MLHLPKFLIWSRIVISPVMIALAFIAESRAGIFINLLAVYGLVSDIFDGIIARKLGVSSEKLRRLDSTADQIFWLSVLASTFLSAQDFFYNHWAELGFILILEAATYGCSFIRFRKEVATHSLLAKFWTLSLFATVFELNSSGSSGIIYSVCFYLGIISRLEILAILLTLRNWPNDVPSLYHAWQLRQGREISRNKLFNG